VPPIIAPGTPIFNPYAPSNVIGEVKTYVPLAYYNPFTGQFYPVLARNWTVQVLPNGSGILTIYLRKGFYWFNGSAVMPFTAWDVYARFYIGMKAFAWYVPWINQSLVDEDVRVLNNYTIQFLFQRWTPYIPYWLLTSWIDVPYPVWKPIVDIVDKLKTITNVTQAMAFGSNNVTKFIAPYWGIGPYYMTYISSSSGTYMLDPMYYNGVPLLARWLEIFPLNSWNYHAPQIQIFWLGGNAQDMAAFLAGKANTGLVGLSLQQVGTLNKSGILSMLSQDFSAFGITFNPNYYPWNIPEVRKALCYAINKTAVAAAWGLFVPDPYPELVPPYLVDTFPPDVRQYLIPCHYDPAKAAQILESLGFKKINGYWYTPNGTKLTLDVIGPAGFTDWMTQTSEAVEQLDAFGIDAKLIGQEVSTYWGTTIPNNQYEAADEWLGWVHGYLSAGMYLGGWPSWMPAYFPPPPQGRGWSTPQPFQWPNGTCSPVYMPVVHTPYGNLKTPNGTIVWCINSTLGYFNATNWINARALAYPGTPDYDLLLKTLFAWNWYFVPTVPLGAKIEPIEYAWYLLDPGYVYQCLPFSTRESIVYGPHIWGSTWGWNAGEVFATYFGAWAPAGEVPPLAQAIANGSLWTNPSLKVVANFLGLPKPDVKIQECVASYFHIPYTQVTTTTTTSTTTTTTTTTTITTAVSTVTSTTTVTSTVTSTSVSTTTATTVTVTKPVISTALIAGIVVIVVVIAAVTAIIALRRR
jgi:peptide/nickel transport system substrate-binding protein